MIIPTKPSPEEVATALARYQSTKRGAPKSQTGFGLSLPQTWRVGPPVVRNDQTPPPSARERKMAIAEHQAREQAYQAELRASLPYKREVYARLGISTQDPQAVIQAEVVKVYKTWRGWRRY